MQPKNYMLIIPNLKTGGVLTAAVNVCNELSKRGNGVDILVMNGDRPPAGVLLPEIGFLRLTGRAKLWNLGKPMIQSCEKPFLRLILSVLGVLKKLLNKKHLWIRFVFGNKQYFSNYDAVLAYKQGAPCYDFALHCVAAKKKIAFVHGDLAFMGDVSMWIRYLYDFDRVAYVSNGVKDGFIQAYPRLQKNAITVYNLFDAEQIQEKAKEEAEIVWEEGLIRLVTVSRIENVTKAIFRIPEICEKLYQRFGAIFQWYVVGDGPCLDECRRITEEKGMTNLLFFVGERQNPYPYIFHADFTVLPSLTEAFGMAVIESLIIGCPVVVSRYPAAEEILPDERYGLIAEQNSESIFERISELMSNKERLLSLRKNCSAYRYQNEQAYEQLIKALDL